MNKDHEDHFTDLHRLVNSTLRDMDKFCLDTTGSLTTFSEYFDQILKLKEEEESLVEELKLKVGEFQATHEHIKQQLALLEKRKEAVKKEKENVTEQKVLKSKHLKRVTKDHETRKQVVESLTRHLAKDLESQPTLDRNKCELLLYKKLSGIAWDFSAPSNLVKGYVSNKANDYCKPFCFDKNRMTDSEISDALWNEINLSSLQFRD